MSGERKNELGAPVPPPAQALKQRDVSGTPGSSTPPLPMGTELRDPRFAELDRSIASENGNGDDEPQARTFPKKKPRTGTNPRSRLRPAQRDACASDDQTADALKQAKEIARAAAQQILTAYGEALDRHARVQVATAFRTAVVPTRKPGRKRKAQITAALADYQNDMRGSALYRKYIRGFDGMSKWRRAVESRRLMEAIRTRKRRERKAASSTQSVNGHSQDSEERCASLKLRL